MKTILHNSMLMFSCILMMISGLTGFRASAQQTTVNPSALIGTSEKITAYSETERFYWIGTESGLYQVKKKNGKVSHLTEKNSQLPSNQVTAICTRSNGEVFIGTTNGILRYDRFAFMVVNIENANLSSNSITALHTDHDDNIWIGSSANSLSLIRYASMKNFNNISTPDSGDHIVSFENDQNGVIMVMASGSHLKLTDGQVQKAVGSETASTR